MPIIALIAAAAAVAAWAGARTVEAVTDDPDVEPFGHGLLKGFVPSLLLVVVVWLVMTGRLKWS